MVVAVQNPSERAVPLSGDGVAADTAMNADRWCGLEIPLACEVMLQRFVRENAGGADLDEVSTELAFEHAVFMAAEIHLVMTREDIEVTPACVVTVETDTTVALDAAVHFVINEGAHVLIAVRPFLESGPPIAVAGHDRHVLEMAFTAFIADRAVMRMVQHEPLNHARPESPGLGIIHGKAHALSYRSHAGHHDPAAGVLFVLELFYRALAASAHRVHGRVPTEIGEVEAERKTSAQEVLAFFYLIGLIVDEDCNHKIFLIIKKCT